MIFLSLFIVGLLVGIISSLLGIGGGALIVPTLLSLFPKIPFQIVTATSLFFIFINSIIINLKFYRTKTLNIDYKASMKLNIASIIGGLIGAKLILGISPQTFKIGFASILLMLSLRLLLQKASTKDSDQLKQIPAWKFIITGLIGGIISSLTGLGGGAVFVPMLIAFVKMPMQYVSPYSNLAMTFATLSGLIPHFFQTQEYSWENAQLLNQFQLGNVSLLLPLIILSGAIITSSIGVKLNSTLSARTKKLTFAFLLIALALKTFIGAI